MLFYISKANILINCVSKLINHNPKSKKFGPNYGNNQLFKALKIKKMRK